MQSVTERCGQTLGTSSTNQNTNKYPETFNLWFMPERIIVLRHILAVLWEMFWITPINDRWIGIGEPTAWPQRSPDFNPMDSYLWGDLKSLVNAASVDNEEALHHRLVGVCQTIGNCPGIFARIRRSMMRRVEVCIESHGGHLEHLL
jgi:hypothetical protein